MRLSEVKKVLENAQELKVQLPDGTFIPAHFHITEVGKIAKDFIDCGGTVRSETVASLQLWYAADVEHRLKPKKLITIIELAEKILQLPNLEVEVEYQGPTIGKYGLSFDGEHFQLVSKATACLALEDCGIPTDMLQTASASATEPACTPGGNCC